MKTFKCVCGHLAYKLPKRGWLCHCSSPKPQPAPIDRKIIQPDEINVARIVADIECRGD